jgi:AraC-like DNA-binding protein
MPAAEVVPLVDALLRGMLLALLLAMATALAREGPGGRERVVLWLALGVAVQVLGSMPAIESHWRPLWQAPLVAIAVGNAVLFWLVVRTLFDDEFEPRAVHALAWGAAAALGFFNAGVVAELRWPIAPWTFGLQRVVPLLCAALAVWALVRHWQSDLVESRRRLRVFIAVVGSIYTLVQVALRMHSGTGLLSEGAALFDTGLMLVLVGGIAWRVVRVAPQELFGPPSAAPTAPAALAALAARGAPAALDRAAPQPTATTPADTGKVEPVDPADERLEATLLRAMREERVYREEALSVSSLARRLAVPEYRLRRVIVQRLGHRNFNAFVNAYRLAESQAALANPAQRALPVLTIALDAGFQSIGPFNRAFKAATGLTPTEYRARALAPAPAKAEPDRADS